MIHVGIPPNKPQAGQVDANLPAKHSHYKKNVAHLSFIDVYRVIDLFGVTHPALQHALKKVLCAGGRGQKDWVKDVQEAIDSLNRALEMQGEDDAK